MNRKSHRRRVQVTGDGRGCVSLAGTVTLLETARVSGLEQTLRAALEPWHRDRATHHPAKVVLDLAVAVAVGGDCPADVSALQGCDDVFGAVASTPTVSRTMDRLAADAPEVLAAVRAARAAARARVWAADAATHSDRSWLVLDVDATIIEAYSPKDRATGHYKRGFGFAPMLGYVDHGDGGTGEPVASVLRPGNANPNNAADQIAAVELALAQLPADHDTAVLFRADSAGQSHQLVDWLVDHDIAFSVGFQMRPNITAALEGLPRQAWRRAIDADGQRRDSTWVAELTSHLDMSRWPAGTRVIARKERPLPGTQLSFPDFDGHRVTVFATNTTGKIVALDLRHRHRARVEDRIRAAKDTGLRNLPYRDFDHNQIWCEIVAIAQDLTAWLQRLALTSDHQVAEPKTLRLRIFSAAGQLAHTGRTLRLRLDRSWRWTPEIVTAIDRLHALSPG